MEPDNATPPTPPPKTTPASVPPTITQITPTALTAPTTVRSVSPNQNVITFKNSRGSSNDKKGKKVGFDEVIFHLLNFVDTFE